MTAKEICKVLREAFPDETVHVGQRINKRQAEIINMLVLEMKIAAAKALL